MIKFNSTELWDKLTIEQSKSGGYHIFYYCEIIEGNKKLAMRYTTEEEREVNPKEKVKVLLETRGEGGYVAVYPTEGCKLIARDFECIQVITADERDILFSCARALDEVNDDIYKPKPKEVEWIETSKTPWEDFDDRGDTVALLQSHGWTVTGDSGGRTYLKRPGDTKAKFSGHYNHDLKMFKTFSSSTEFEVEKGYMPSAVYTILECNGDFSQAGKELYHMGYGDRAKKIDMTVETQEVEQEVKESAVKSPKELRHMQNKYLRGEIPMGLSTGWATLDNHWRFKRGYFNVNLGHANTGKSTIEWYKNLVAAVKHGWKFMVYSPENVAWRLSGEMVEWLCGVTPDEAKRGAMNEIEIEKAQDFIFDHFFFVEMDEEWSYKQVIEEAQKLKAEKHIDAVLIDPYNSLTKDWNLVDRREGGHEYDYIAAGRIKQWAKHNDCTIQVNCHAATEAIRRFHPKGHDKEGQLTPPNAADAEGGGKWVARCDDFTVYHRYTQDKFDWNVVEIHIKKIKETYSGGRPTFIDEPVKLTLKKENGFFGFFDEYNNCPLEGWLKGREKGMQTMIPKEVPHPDNWTVGVNEKNNLEDAPF
jgi:hypothetical protein